MASGLVIHVSSGAGKHTEVLSQERIRIGPGEDCNLRLRPSLLARPAQSGSLLELARSNGHYRVASFDPSFIITHNGAPLTPETKIEDGDEVRIEDSNLALQFFPVRALPAIIERRQSSQVAPFIEHAAIEAAATPRRDDAKVFLREFTRELVREINTSTKLIALAISLALVGGILYIGFSMYKEVQRNRRIVEDQRAQIAQAQKQLEGTAQQLRDLVQSNSDLQKSLSVAVMVRNNYGRGVCLISGSYIFAEQGTGRPLRYPEAQTSDDRTSAQNTNESLQLTPEGKGSVAEFEFVGTGFYVGQGYVLTNRHVVNAWLADERLMSMGSSTGGQPRLKKLYAYFPNRPHAVPLKFKVAAQRDDLAIAVFDMTDIPSDIPVLPLEKDSEAVAVGQSVVMMGYPSGPDRMLALLDDAERNSAQVRYGGSLEALLGYLAGKNLIQPLTTQGSITDLNQNQRRIVYDARTAEGGSGAPLFGTSARVVGINFAIFTENTASNFAVPVRYGISLLERAGWKPPEAVEAEQNNQNSNQNNPHNNSAQAITPR